LLPDFEAYDKSKNHKAFVEELGWGDKVFFRLHLRGIDRNSVPKIIENNKSEEGGFRFSGRLGKPDEIKYGLEVYYTKINSRDDYLYRPSEGVIVYIACASKKMNVPSPSCEMLWDHSKTVYADAIFSKKYLPHWKSIHKRINDVIKKDSFRGE
jgi:hypothetical protein